MLNQATKTENENERERERKMERDREIKGKKNVPTHNGPKGDRNLINAR